MRAMPRAGSLIAAAALLLQAVPSTAQTVKYEPTDGVPTFAVRSANVLKEARADDSVGRGRWVHLMGVLEAGGKLRVWVDGKPSGDAVQGALIKVTPADGMSVGADLGSRVGDYNDPQYWTGKLRDVRYYRGPLTEKELRAWAKPAE